MAKDWQKWAEEWPVEAQERQKAIFERWQKLLKPSFLNEPIVRQAVGKAYAAAGLKPPGAVVILQHPLSLAVIERIYQIPEYWSTLIKDATMPGLPLRNVVREALQKCYVLKRFGGVAKPPEFIREEVVSGLLELMQKGVPMPGKRRWKPLNNEVTEHVRDKLLGWLRMNGARELMLGVGNRMRMGILDTRFDLTNVLQHAELLGSRLSMDWSTGTSVHIEQVMFDAPFYDFVTETLGVPNLLEPMEQLCENGIAAWWPFKHAAFMMVWPKSVRRDVHGRLHSSELPAVEYQDGIKYYFWHGTLIPEYVILEPGKITVDKILGESNIEFRRILLERFGVDRFFKNFPAGTIDLDEDAYHNDRKLVKLDLVGDEPLVAVGLVCPSTGRKYFLRVPPQTRTCAEAVAWTFGFSKDIYHPLVET